VVGDASRNLTPNPFPRGKGTIAEGNLTALVIRNQDLLRRLKQQGESIGVMEVRFVGTVAKRPV